MPSTIAILPRIFRFPWPELTMMISSKWVLLTLVLVLPGTFADAQANKNNQAKALFNQAERHFAASEYEKALDLYQKAYEAKPLPGFYFNMGQCYRNLGQYAKAIEHFQQYLNLSKNPKHEAEASGLISLCQEELAKQKRAEKEKQMAIPVPQPETQQHSNAQTLITSSAGGPAHPPLHPAYFWSGVTLTAAFLLTGTITGSLALKKSSEFKDPSTPKSRLNDLKDSGETQRTVSNVTFGLGIASAAATTALFFFTDFSKPKRTITASPVSGGTVVSLGGAF